MTGPAEWRVDPTGRHQWRFWDGERFTEWVADDGVPTVDPGAVPPGAPAWASRPDTDVVEMGFGSPRRQNRWTVGFRLILVLPHFVWALLLAIAATVVLFVGWFAALFTGRLPEGMARFLHQVVQYYARLSAYFYLLVGEYPPFALSNDTYPVVVETNPGRLNRWAVAFRLILAIPAGIVVNVVSGGLSIVAVFLWIVVLAKGEMPRTGAEAVAAVIRYETRLYAYLAFLTGTYPGGLYGDGDGDGPHLGSTPSPSAPVAPLAPPRTARLVLSRSAKRLVTLFIVVGIVQSVATNVLNVRIDARDRASGAVVVRDDSSANRTG